VFGTAILASTCEQKYAGEGKRTALFTVCGHFAPSGVVRESRLVEFGDDPAP
jgi:hypothetical protein